MIQADETALICDLAETYGILDYRALPLKTAAALASGLRDDSRIRMAMSGQHLTINTALLAAAVDRLSMLWWAKTKDGYNGKNPPESMLLMLTGRQEEKKKKDIKVFRTPEEFEAARARALKGVNHGD